MTSDHDEYALKQLENWIHDVMSSEATPSEIYDCIYNAICENYYYHKHHTSRAYELMVLMNGNRHLINQTSSEKSLTCDKDDETDEYKNAWEDFWNNDDPEETNSSSQSWVVSVEEDKFNDDYFITIPNDLLEKVGWKENDDLQWIDNEDGSWILKKVEKENT